MLTLIKSCLLGRDLSNLFLYLSAGTYLIKVNNGNTRIVVKFVQS